MEAERRYAPLASIKSPQVSRGLSFFVLPSFRSLFPSFFVPSLTSHNATRRNAGRRLPLARHSTPLHACTPRRSTPILLLHTPGLWTLWTLTFSFSFAAPSLQLHFGHHPLHSVRTSHITHHVRTHVHTYTQRTHIHVNTHLLYSPIEYSPIECTVHGSRRLQYSFMCSQLTNAHLGDSRLTTRARPFRPEVPRSRVVDGRWSILAY